jgi:hypothetical protein
MVRYPSAHGISCCCCMNSLGAANLRMDRVRSGGRWFVHWYRAHSITPCTLIAYSVTNTCISVNTIMPVHRKESDAIARSIAFFLRLLLVTVPNRKYLSCSVTYALYHIPVFFHFHVRMYFDLFFEGRWTESSFLTLFLTSSKII